jgi:hypothetical protein
MSGLGYRTGKGMLGWIGPHRVAPGRMPKAEATELAPRRSAADPRDLSGVCFCGVDWVKLPSEGFGL